MIGKDNDVPIWKICKKYDAESIDTEDSSIGLAIDVEFLSIGSSYTEYLVPFDMLIQKLNTIGLTLERSELFKATYETNKQYEKKFPMSSSVKQFSFLNRWFIFRRIHQRREVVREELPPLPLILDPSIYTQGFDKETTGSDRTGMYAKLITVPSSDYSVLKPWHKEQVKEVLEGWFPNKEDITTIVDATAHIGVDTLYMTKLFPRAIVHSFEVVPETFVALRKNLEMFDPQGQIVPHNQDSTTWEPTEVVNFLFVDPPWGADYKKPKKSGKSTGIELYLEKEKTATEKKEHPHDESKNIKQLITKWLGSGLIQNIVLKTPPNFNKNGLPAHKEVEVLNRGGKESAYCLMLFTADRGSKLAVLEEKEDVEPFVQNEIVVAPKAPVRKQIRKPTSALVFKIGTLKGKQPSQVLTVLDTENIDRWMALQKGPVAIDNLPTNAALWLGGSVGSPVGASIDPPRGVMLPEDIKFTIEPFNKYKSMDDYMKMITSYLTTVSASKVQVYPTIEMYLMAMRIKFTSSEPTDYTRGTFKGSIPKSFTDSIIAAPPFSEAYFNLIEKQSAKVKEKVATFNDKKSKIVYDNILWNKIRNTFIAFAIHYRMERDVIFRNIIQSLKNANYTLEYVESANNANLESGKIKSGITHAIIAESGLGDVEVSKKALQPPRSAPIASDISVATSSEAAQSVAAQSVAAQSAATSSVATSSVAAADAPKEVPLFQGEPIPSEAEAEAEAVAEPAATIPKISLFEEEPIDE
jgi:hypothetical protein